MVELSERLTNLSPAKRRLLEQRLKKKPGVAEPIAIVGMSCRFAGAHNLQEYWRIIHDGIDGTGEIPSWRWDVEGLYDSTGQETGKMSVKWAGMVDGIDQFDPMFFGISPREASRMDPQQRLLLEVSWEALEVAGLAPDRMSGTATGVFVGIGGTDYSKIPSQFEDYYHYIDAHVGTGNALSIAANRVSYILDLRGPSMAIDTACSSGMMGLHLAMQALRNRDCDAALAGGVNAILTPETTIAFSKAQMLSSDGHCRPFDSAANGYVRGEGCGMIVLKRLTDAQRDGDNVLAVVRASATNQDGRTSGITAPNGVSQQKCIHAALKQAGLTTDQVSYIEAHGTGTPLGDPIEVDALGKVFRQRSEKDSPLHISSVKANIGHTETVSGIAGIIKVVLMMQHRQIPPQLHFHELNPHMSLDGTRLRIPQELTEWKTYGKTRVAGVSSFGFGGSNTHVIIEEAQPAKQPAAPEIDRDLHLMTLSAKSKSALERLAKRHAEFVSENPDVALADLCNSMNVGRSHFNHRATIAAPNRTDLLEKLAAIAEGKKASGVKLAQVKLATAPKVAFLFTGQGSQYVGMGRGLYETQPVFRETLDECDAILREELEQSLLSVLYPESDAPTPIDETAYTQPALFSIEYALAKLWRSWGIEPSVLIGHSVGEYVAATVSGILSLEDGLRLIAKRASLMQRLPRDGSMAVIFASMDETQKQLRGFETRVSIAAANGPENTVISGKADAVQELIEQFEADGVKTQPLTVSHAFHSPLMDPMLDEFESFAETIDFQAPQIPVVSNLTGQLITEEPPRAGYWRSHVRNAVRFADGMQLLTEQNVHVMLEIGPAPILLGMGRRCLPKSEAAWLPSLRKGQSDSKILFNTLAELYGAGATIDWRGFDSPWPRRKVILPTYPFEQNRYWFTADTAKRSSLGGRGGPVVHPLLGSRIPSALDATLFEGRLSSRSPAYLVDHQVQGSPVVPAAAYIEQGFATAEQVFGDGHHLLENISIQQAMFLPESHPRAVQVTASKEMGGQCNFEVYSVPADTEDPNSRWALHACGNLRHAESEEKTPRVVDLDEVRENVTSEQTRDEFYELMRSRGLAYGPAFEVLEEVQRADECAIAKVNLPEKIVKELSDYHLHPALGDACFQSVASVVPLESDGSYSPYTYMPTGANRVQIHGELCDNMLTYAIRTSDDDGPSPEAVEADVFLVDESGRVLVEFSGVRVQRVGKSVGGAGETDVRDWLYQIHWQRQALDEAANAAPRGTWVIFADSQGVARQLADSIHGQCRCIMVTPGDKFSETIAENGDAGLYRINPLATDDYKRLFEEVIGKDGTGCAGIVHLWSLDVPVLERDGKQQLESARSLSTGSVLQLIRQVSRARLPKPPQMWLATRGAQSVTDEDSSLSPAQSALWGLGRVAAVEHAELKCRLLDLDPDVSKSDAARAVANELSQPTDESQIAYRGNERFVARLKSDPQAIAADDSKQQGTLSVAKDSPFRLRLGTAGSFDSLWFESSKRELPEPGQVELEVRATGLNFSDVLKAMGLYPGIKDKVVPLGIECSGVVTALGEGVDAFQVGDEVMGVVPFSFASHARTADYCLVPKPKNIDDCEAATVPITFLTAYYGLIRLAQMQPGERVLIHAGAGGVGLAAIQIAQHIGAEVFATAGSDEKRDYLRSLGVEHVLNSRTVDFADEIMAATGREGVDIVLNSLPGDAIPKSLGILRAYGRFLEIGKTDIYKNSMIGLAPFQDNLSYFAIDLDRMLRQRPDYVRKMFPEMMEYFDRGIYQPLVLTQFSIDETVDAFRYMAQRKNIGKVVVSLERDAADPSDDQQEADDEAKLIRADGTYLVTGGLGALGLRVAGWLVEQGAQRIALMSRREPSDEARQSIDALATDGVSITAIQGDASDQQSLKGAFSQIPKDWPKLRGVIHAAGVLADGVLFDMELDQLDKALAPKVQGGWNLHAATLDQPLDFFVLFSSVACILGSPGQGNYAAANAFLDGLAQFRRSQGLPATSINWGPWAGSGMAAEGGREDQIKSRGMDLIDPENGLDLIGRLLEADATNVTVMDAHWSDMFKLMSGRVPSLLATIAETEGNASDDSAAEDVDHEYRNRLLGADLDERQTLLREYFTDELARIMGLEADDLDQSQPLSELGMDSLLAMELKNNLERTLAFQMPMAAFLETPSITTLAEHAAKAIASDEGTTETTATAPMEKEEDWSPLVPLQNEGSKPPLFCVHPLGGDVGCYYDFARAMGGERQVYALKGRGSEGRFDPHLSLDDMARDYIQAIRDLQPEGPYYLTSWSAGGIYSIEIARQLRQQGAEVGLLALFDTPLPSIYDDVNVEDDIQFLFDLANFANWFSGANIDMKVFSAQPFETLDEQGRWDLTLEIGKQHGAVPQDASSDHLRRVVQAGKSHAKMIKAYQPGAFGQKIVLFRPEQPNVLAEMTGQTHPADLGWGEILGDDLQMKQSAGDHFTMMRGENAMELARRVNETLQQLEARPK